MTQTSILTETIREDMASDPRLMFPLRSVSLLERENRQKYKRDRVKETSLAGQQTLGAKENEDSRESAGLWGSLLLQKT